MKQLRFASVFALAVLAVVGLADSATASRRDFPPPDDPGQFNVGVTTFSATMSAGRVTRIQVYYRIDGTERIASELTVGAEPLLKLANSTTAGRRQPDAPANGSAHHGAKDYRSLTASRLNRKGLKAGAPAPDFRLPRLDGGELVLADLRGGRVLLVFSDPRCGPCEELAPRLQAIHLERADLTVLVVSRGDVEADRANADALGLSFPIVLQQKWEVSLQYAMFATPIGYLIDEEGILLSDVAVGVEPILALADEPSVVGAPASAGALEFRL